MTELVELQQKLEKVEGLQAARTGCYFDSSYDGLYITDGEGNTLRLNKGFERITE
jgi:PAS domain-containing protein